MTFEQFAAIVRDWSSRMTPGELHVAVERCLARGLPIDDLAPGTTAEAVLLRAAEHGRPVAELLHEAAKSAPTAMLTGEPKTGEPVPPVLYGEVIPPNAGARREGNKTTSSRDEVSSNGSATSNPQPVGKRARTLLREQLKHGPRPGDQVEAAAEAADIPKRVLIAAASVPEGAMVAAGLVAKACCYPQRYPKPKVVWTDIH